VLHIIFSLRQVTPCHLPHKDMRYAMLNCGEDGQASRDVKILLSVLSFSLDLATIGQVTAKGLRLDSMSRMIC